MGVNFFTSSDSQTSEEEEKGKVYSKGQVCGFIRYIIVSQQTGQFTGARESQMRVLVITVFQTLLSCSPNAPKYTKCTGMK